MIKKPIRTVRDLQGFMISVAELLQMELLMNPFPKEVLGLIESFRDKGLQIFTAIDVNKTGAKSIDELGLSPNDILNPDAQRLARELQVQVIEKDLMAMELVAMSPLPGLLLMISASMDPHAQHCHKCSKCGTQWEHSNMCAGDTQAHTCEKCGHVEWARH